ncbi:hypothetical protein FQN54_001348 [Arachnomyces sp. PD_36]|nr:hypothetical protein FQN54_001348 [Arachnomyces sp. PD_36]
MAPAGAALWRSLHAYQVFGANTNIGKTVISTLLYKASQSRHSERNHWFLKPVSTGPQAEADDSHISRFAKGVSVKCLYSFDEPVSPHLAARSTTPPRDSEILSTALESLESWALSSPQELGLALVETAGGVHSPGPNGTSQADLYRPLRLPVILIADSKLGGISSSVSSFESLSLRGYDVESVMLFRDDYYKNDEYLSDYFGKMGIPVFAFPAPPELPAVNDEDSVSEDRTAMSSYYENTAAGDHAGSMIDLLSDRHHKRLERLKSMSNRARDVIWYPFTQHQGITSKDITVIDSAHGDYFQTYRRPTNDTPPNQKESSIQRSLIAGQEDPKVIQPTFDGSASWWTQGLGHANPTLSLSAAYAAGRYGHVMFAGAIHEPALSLAELLIRSVGNPRLQKVFYSDNGSTGMEVAIKMGLRAACERYGWEAHEKEVGIIGLQGSYHGDTIGVMDCSEPSTFNQKVEWYRGRGYWFNFPQVKLVEGVWKVDVPDSLKATLGESTQFSNLNQIFDLELRKEKGGGDRYRSYIKSTLEDLVSKQGKRFGAVMLEPILLGAGGMLFVDPLFQHTLVQVVRENPHIFSGASGDKSSTSNATMGKGSRWSGLPIIFDEVFTGMYRLGRFTSASFLGVHPDISTHAKLLTGGLVPLCVTLASEDIFKAFLGCDKSDALLHGHSYTAHAVGCNVAVTSLQTMIKMEKSGEWDEYRKDWNLPSKDPGPLLRGKGLEELSDIWSSWSRGFVDDLSHAGSVESVFALGSVLSITLRDPGAGGYTSTAAKGLQDRLAMKNDQAFNIHSRVLGNVLYLMASMTSKRSDLREIEGLVRACLKDD